METTPTYVLFRGNETDQLSRINGAPANAGLWYIQPREYTGVALYYSGFPSAEAAIAWYISTHATPNKCRIPGSDGTPCYALNADCPHTTIDTVLAGRQLVSGRPLPGSPTTGGHTQQETTMDYPEIPTGTEANGHWLPVDAALPVPLPPGFPAAPAEACATLVVCGHEIEIVLRDVDESRLLARMTGLLEAWDEGDEEDGEDDVN